MIMTGDKEYNMMNEIAVLRAQCEKLTAALREALIDARNNGLIYWEPQTTRGAMNKQLLLARIDAALSAASGETRHLEPNEQKAMHNALRKSATTVHNATSGEASGDDVFEDPDKQEWPTPDDLGPAPSEAPNVGRAEKVWRDICRCGGPETRIAEALAAARAAERERCELIALRHEDSVHNVANTCRAIAAAIRAGAKP